MGCLVWLRLRPYRNFAGADIYSRQTGWPFHSKGRTAGNLKPNAARTGASSSFLAWMLSATFMSA
jgi:hypothetical protein